MEKPKNDFAHPYALGNCTICGGNNFEWGRLGGQVGYHPGIGMWSFNHKAVRARRCLQCNNLVSFVDAELSHQQNRAVFLIIAVMLLFYCGMIAFIFMTILR